jgi:hypothetical protein
MATRVASYGPEVGIGAPEFLLTTPNLRLGSKNYLAIPKQEAFGAQLKMLLSIVS